MFVSFYAIKIPTIYQKQSYKDEFTEKINNKHPAKCLKRKIHYPFKWIQLIQ